MTTAADRPRLLSPSRCSATRSGSRWPGFWPARAGTRAAYTLDLRQFTSWCRQRGLHLFDARRADIECFGRDLEARGRARAAIARRLCTVTGFDRYNVEADLLDYSPAAHAHRPRLDYESHVTGLDRSEIGAPARRRRTRPSERTRVDLTAGDQRTEGVRSHRRRYRSFPPGTGTRHPDCARKASKIATIPWPAHRPRRRPGHRRTPRGADLPTPRRAAPRPARRRAHRQPRRHQQTRQPAHPTARDRSPRRRRPVTRRARSRLPRRPPHPPCATTGHASHSTGTPPTSSPPTSPEPPDSQLPPIRIMCVTEPSQAHRPHPSATRIV